MPITRTATNPSERPTIESEWKREGNGAACSKAGFQYSSRNAYFLSEPPISPDPWSGLSAMPAGTDVCGCHDLSYLSASTLAELFPCRQFEWTEGGALNYVIGFGRALRSPVPS
jgi:hypothetical protein